MYQRTFLAVPLLPGIEQKLVTLVSPVCYAILVALLIYRLFRPNKSAIGVCIALVVLILLDVHRLQIWVWFYLLWLLLKRHETTGFRALVACVYLWSGLNKLNPHFLQDVIPDWQKTLHVSGETFQYALAGLAIVTELALAVGIWRYIQQRWVVVAAIGLHLFILLVLVLQGNWNLVVWPWNLALIAGVWYCHKFAQQDHEAHQQNLLNWQLPLGLAGIMPALYSVGIWPYTLSWMLYSGLQPEITLASNRNFAAQMPPEVAKMVFEVDGESFLVLDDWTFAEAQVPPFQHAAVFERHAQHWCETALAGQARFTYRLTPQRFCKNCADLKKNTCPKQEEKFPGMGLK
jgi:hypothetical protein